MESLHNHWSSRFRHSRRYYTLEWQQNYVLQLHRLAHEEVGSGTWKGCDKDIPFTERNEALVSLDISDLSHPKLQVGKRLMDQEV